MSGSDVHTTNYRGDTLLHVAAKLNKPEILRYLMDAGVDPEESNNIGMIPKDLLPDARFEKILEGKRHSTILDTRESSQKKSARFSVLSLGNRNYIIPMMDGGMASYHSKNTMTSVAKSNANIAGNNNKRVRADYSKLE